MANKIPERIIPHTGQVTQNYGVRHLFEVFYSLSTQTPPGALPLWTGQELYNCKNDYPAFWKKALELKNAGKIRVVSESVYNKEIAAPDISSGKAENAKSFGQTGAFVINEATGYLRLPKITQFIQSIDGAAENGVAQLDAIRNITGTIGPLIEESAHGKYTNGAFYEDGTGTGHAGGTDYIVKMNVSRNVPVADRVRPRNVQMALYIQVSNPKLDDAELQQVQLDRQYIESVKTEINNIKKELQNELILVRNETAISSLPDMSRAVFLEETDYSQNDKGCIFKINVPGWLVPMDRRESYDGEYDWTYTFGQCPGYLYYGASPGAYGRWNRFNNQSGRFSPCGMVNGGWRVQFPYPIVPGDRCYFSLDDASSVNYQKQLWFVPSISVPKEINRKHYVTRVAKKYQSPNRNDATENPILTDSKVDRVFHSASKPWTSNFTVSGTTWNLKAPTDVWAYMPFSFKLGQGTRGSSGWDVNQQYWLMQTTQLNPWKRMWWRNDGTYILRFIPAREIDDVIAEIAASSNAKYLDNHYDGSITKNTVRGWLEACKNRWVICNRTVYRKKVGGVEWWEKHGHLRESDYDSTNGDAAWSYWQNICLVSKEAGLICPPINHKNGVCRWNAGYALRNTALDTLPQLNWVGCGAKDTFGVADADKSGGIDYTTILNHQEKYRASYMSTYEVWAEKYKFWK
jgi:hypothetical protein